MGLRKRRRSRVRWQAVWSPVAAGCVLGILGLALGLGLGGCRKAPPRGKGAKDPAMVERDAGEGRRRAPVPGAAVALLLGPDATGRQRLFQVTPGGGPPRAVQLPLTGSVASAVTSEGGTAVALVLQRDGGARVLLTAVAQGGLAFQEVALPKLRLRLVKAISPDGRTVVVERDPEDLAVIRVAAGQGTVVPLTPPTPGRPRYGVAVSADGLRVAFSAMRADCASGIAAQARCPVSLYGLDLGAPGRGVRALDAGAGPGEVRYHPQFEDPRGDRLLYMTTAGDTSERCRQHVNQCRYAIHRVAFGGGRSERVMADAVLFHRAYDGTLSFRRLRPPDTSGFRWAKSTLWIAPPGQPPRVVLKERLALRTHWFAPDGRHLLVTTEGGPEGRALELLGRDGRPAGPRVPGTQVVAVGWAVRALAAGKGRLAVSPGVRRAREALALALAAAGATGKPGGGGAPVAWLGVPPQTLRQVHQDARTLPDRAAALAWLREGTGRVLILTRRAWCDLEVASRRSGPRLRAVDSVATAGAVGEPGMALVIARPVAGKAAPEGKGTGATEPVAAFQLEPNRGRLVLERIDLPKTVERGKRLVVTLHWRVEEPPPPGWQVFVHVDGQGQRLLGDHPAALCGTAGWQRGQRVKDRFVMETRSTTGVTPPGRYTFFVGWFRGARRAEITVPRSVGGRAKVGTLVIQP